MVWALSFSSTPIEACNMDSQETRYVVYLLDFYAALLSKVSGQLKEIE